jgi:hypothetical protein
MRESRTMLMVCTRRAASTAFVSATMVARQRKKGSDSAEFLARRSVAPTNSSPPNDGPYATRLSFQNVKRGDVFVFAQSFFPYGSSSIILVREVRTWVKKSFITHAAAQKRRASATAGSKIASGGDLLGIALRGFK